LPLSSAPELHYQGAVTGDEAQLAGKVALVTGASAGIGEALAREIVRRGGSVLLVARREARVRELASELGERAVGVGGDVTRDGDVARAVAIARERFGGLDLLFANAGFGVSGRFEQLSLADYQRQFDTNVFGVLRSTREALPELRLRGGAIGIVGSVNGYVSIDGWSAYCMSKHAVRSFATCLRAELASAGVSVTHLAPGFVESEFRRVDNQAQLSENARDPVPTFLIMPAARAASMMVSAVLSRRAEAVITGHGKLAVHFERHAPWLVSRALGVGAGIARRFGKPV
jgi:NAD(P)-dependent dehydrogenase (short-subunit alcohol dehydrogenase family)